MGASGKTAASSTLSAVLSHTLTVLNVPCAREVAQACHLARTALCYVPPEEHRPLRALECAEAWVRAGAPAEQYGAVGQARMAAGYCASLAAASASRLSPGSAERLEAELLTQAALAARRAARGDVRGVEECLRSIAALTSTAGAGGALMSTTLKKRSSTPASGCGAEEGGVP